MIVKSVWKNFAACSWTASTTRGCAWPTLRQPTPPVKSMNVFPSTSVSVAPSPRSITTGKKIESGSAITRFFRSRIALERGPGIAVLSSIVFVAAMRLTIAESAAALNTCIGELHGAPTSDTCRPLARDHAAPESPSYLPRAPSLGCERVRPPAWCSRPRDSTASLAGALAKRRCGQRLDRVEAGRVPQHEAFGMLESRGLDLVLDVRERIGAAQGEVLQPWNQLGRVASHGV